MFPQTDPKKTCWPRSTFNLETLSVKSFKEWHAAHIFFFRLRLKYLVGYFGSAHFLGSDVCTSVTIFLVIRQSGEGCPCQEGGQGTNSFLFPDTFIYQARLHASHTLQVGVHVCVSVCGVKMGDKMSGTWCSGETDGDSERNLLHTQWSRLLSGSKRI